MTGLDKDVVRRILTGARDLLERKGGWIQFNAAANPAGAACAVRSPEACSFCAAGAIDHAYYREFPDYNDKENEIYSQIREHLRLCIIECTSSRRTNLIGYNDQETMTQQGVVYPFNKAIASL